MTLSIAWIRNVGEIEELVLATDSRLRFGCAWDCCPKIMTLPRSDAAISFVGDTMFAYPLMLQMRVAVDMHPRSRSRALDLYDFRGRIVRVFNHMTDYIHDFPTGVSELESPDVLFLLAGYSWKRSNFVIWILHYNSKT